MGDFAPFNRPQFMYASLQSLKEGPAMDQVRANLNGNRDEILQNTFTRGLPEEEHFEVAREFKEDMSYAAERLKKWRADQKAYASVHGDGAYAAQEKFYAIIAHLYESGSLGGVRLIGKVPD